MRYCLTFLLFITFICGDAQMYHRHYEFGEELSASSQYSFLFDDAAFADPSLDKAAGIRKEAGIRRMTVTHFKRNSNSDYVHREGWEESYSEKFVVDHNGVITSCTRTGAGDSIHKSIRLVQSTSRKDSVVQYRYLPGKIIRSGYFKGRLVYATSYPANTDTLPGLRDIDPVSAAHLPVRYKYDGSGHLLRIQHQGDANCSFEVRFTYPVKGTQQVFYRPALINGQMQEFENKTIFDDKGMLLRSSFRKKDDPSEIVHFRVRYDKAGQPVEIIRQVEDAENVREEIYAEIHTEYENGRVISRSVYFTGEHQGKDFTCEYDQLGRMKELSTKTSKLVFRY